MKTFGDFEYGVNQVTADLIISCTGEVLKDRSGFYYKQRPRIIILSDKDSLNCVPMYAVNEVSCE